MPILGHSARLSSGLTMERGRGEDQPQHGGHTSRQRDLGACCGWPRTPCSRLFNPALRPRWLGLAAALGLAVANTAFAQALTEPGHPYSTNTLWDYPHTGEPPMPPVQPLLDIALRDTAITRGPGNTFYLTGTIGPDFMRNNAGIQIWRSSDLKKWEDLGLVWSFERDGTWQKEWTIKNGVRRRALWAPELHYLKGNFYLAFSVTGLGTGLLRSSSGKAEGPYVSATTPDGPLTSGIDASIFVDDDGSAYFLFASGSIARLKDDLSGLAEEPVRLRCLPADADPGHHHPARPCVADQFDHIGFEGTFLFKANGRYYLSGAERYYERYHAMTAESRTLRGPYSTRYVSVPYAGHNTFFQDQNGQWWSTIFGNDAQSPIQKQPGILRVEFDRDGHIRPLVAGAVWQPKRSLNQVKP
jgi:xylan 1,4-beta-xylosidase